jgi:hypothetical protein
MDLAASMEGCLPDHLDEMRGELQLSALFGKMTAVKQEAVPPFHVDAGVAKDVARSRNMWLPNRTSDYVKSLEAVRRLEDLASLTGWKDADTACLFC